VIEHPDQAVSLVEIKSKTQVSGEDIRHLEGLGPDIPNSKQYLLSQDPIPKKIKNTLCPPWQDGLARIFENYI